MSDKERAALVTELSEALKVGSGDTRPFVNQHLMPIIDRVLAERDAQIKYLRDFAFSKACQLFEVESGKPVTKEYAGHILGSIDGNIAVSATRAVAKQGGDA